LLLGFSGGRARPFDFAQDDGPGDWMEAGAVASETRRQSPGLGTVDAAEWRHAVATTQAKACGYRTGANPGNELGHRPT
jgi:hypothetical protein